MTRQIAAEQRRHASGMADTRVVDSYIAKLHSN